jgi:hypothetical protein
VLLARSGALWVALGFSATAIAACSDTPDGTATVTAGAVDAADFPIVEPVFERHCGSLDCHGSIATPMRIYSQNGLRMPNDAGLTPGNGATSEFEITANYDSIISVEPEKITDVAKNKGDPYSLLILKKPLAIESHKGGPAISKGDDAETCISSWIKGTVNLTACANGALPP